MFFKAGVSATKASPDKSAVGRETLDQTPVTPHFMHLGGPC